MKLLYFGTICSKDSFDDICLRSKISPSAAPQNFETLLLKGLSELKNLDLKIHSHPPIPAFPNGSMLFWGNRVDVLELNSRTKWMPVLNIQIVKQICYFIDTFLITLVWGFKNIFDKDKVILVYSIYLPVASAICLLSKLIGIKIVAIVPDLPAYMFSYSKEIGLKNKLTPFYISLSKLVQSHFSGYVFLTEQMSKIVNKRDEPYIVMEGLADLTDVVSISQNVEKEPAIMYAGALNRKFGIDVLLNAFQHIEDSEVELWLFGSGDMIDEILEISNRDARVKYFGRLKRDEILHYQSKAMVLINPRSSHDDYTKYSFPSKTIECMLSGTPLLTTKLIGIPEEYYDHVYCIENESVEGYISSLLGVLSLPKEDVAKKSKGAKVFIEQNKGYSKQALRIYDFIEKIAKGLF